MPLFPRDVKRPLLSAFESLVPYYLRLKSSRGGEIPALSTSDGQGRRSSTPCRFINERPSEDFNKKSEDKKGERKNLDPDFIESGTGVLNSA